MVPKKETSVCRQRVNGFTLIEVLVVVAIIALLISILLPSLSSAREQARAVLCGTNLKQVFMGIHMYTQEYAEVLPHLGYRSDKKVMSWFWPTQLAKSLANKFELYKCPSDKLVQHIDVIYDNIRPRMWLLDSDPPARKVFMDVSYSGSCDLLQEAKPWVIPYKGGTMSLSPVPCRITSYKKPYYEVALIEGEVTGASDGAMCWRYVDLVKNVAGISNTSKTDSDMRSSWRRHNGKTNLLFLDGHIERLMPSQVVDIMRKQEYNKGWW